MDSFSGLLFLACNKSQRLLKVLYWNRNGFWRLQKRLERNRFPWPMNQSEVQEIDEENSHSPIDDSSLSSFLKTGLYNLFFQIHRCIDLSSLSVTVQRNTQPYCQEAPSIP